ncbi:hypothetical protein [Caviibacter abscessus]|uniref:hypothetical protein n=1 Tax=Caviibacter abscessus TaxID=1766719 RepID=UPI0008320931|nr:hypothetical protein [Caviibacter abscessus]
MKTKIILAMLLFQINVFSIGFVNKNFNAVITETTKNKVKEYKIKYTQDKITLEVLKPDLNKGEIYTYFGNKKYIYYKLLDQTVEQTLTSVDSDIIFILKEIRSIKENKNVVINNKQFFVSDNNVQKIVGKGYEVEFKYNKDKMPEKITVKSDNGNTEFVWKY